MLSGKRILVAGDNEWIAAGLVAAITSCDGLEIVPAQTTLPALALIHDLPDGAIVDSLLLVGTISPVARALCDRSVPLVIFTGLGLPSDLQTSHPDIAVILKPSPYEAVIRAIAGRICGR